MKNIKQSHSILILVGAILVPIILFVLVYNIGFRTKSPEITILEPVNNSSVQANSVTIKGKVTPVYSKIAINDKDVNVNNGNFEYEMKLDDSSEINNVYIKATNKDESDSEMLTIKRIFTDEEKKQIETKKLKEEQESLAKEKSELEAYYKTPAGKICKNHKDWSKSDCEKLADNRIWIGMSYEMIKYLRGLPNSANPSNYGAGTEWQWCWYDSTPSCFYDKNNDGLVDMYN